MRPLDETVTPDDYTNPVAGAPRRRAAAGTLRRTQVPFDLSEALAALHRKVAATAL